MSDLSSAPALPSEVDITADDKVDGENLTLGDISNRE